jgi:two-component system, chemotaxis family, CheB/CheR fusion protein
MAITLSVSHGERRRRDDDVQLGVSGSMAPLIIIAVASDAGDLDAVSELLFALPDEYGAAIVVVQHFDAGRARALAATIARQSSVAVTPAHDGAEPERNHVYLLPGNATLAVPSGRLCVTTKSDPVDYPGDALFTSLAQIRGACSVGVVLSGRGADGACGVRAIKHIGGVTFAEHPGSARFPSMPINAIETGCVDFVLRPYEIARELARLGGLSAASTRSAPCGTGIDDQPSNPMAGVVGTGSEHRAS